MPQVGHGSRHPPESLALLLTDHFAQQKGYCRRKKIDPTPLHPGIMALDPVGAQDAATSASHTFSHSLGSCCLDFGGTLLPRSLHEPFSAGCPPAGHASTAPTRYYPPPGTPENPWGPYIQEASGRFGVPEQWIREVMRQV